MTGGAGPKRRGSQFERDVVHHFRDHGFPDVERAYGAGRPEDIGDVVGIPGICCEIKNHARLELARWIDEAERERLNAKQPFAVVIAKRRGKGAAQSYVVMTLESFTRLVTS
jgi:Holliday junction resolvase